MKALFHYQLLTLLILCLGVTRLSAQGLTIPPALAEESTDPTDELLSDLSSEFYASSYREDLAGKDLAIKVSRVHIDLNDESEVEFSARSGWATDFVWKFGDGTVLSGFQNVKHQFRTPGIYEVTLLASNDSKNVKKSIEVNVIDTSVPLELEEMGHYIVFPYDNKLEAEIKLNLPRRERHLKLQIQDIEGREVFEYEIGRVRKHDQIHVDLQNLENGKYYAVLKGKKYNLVSRLTVAR